MSAAAQLSCANCGQRLEPTDKFCRECGLPTLRRAEMAERVSALPPDTQELKRALDAKPEPRPFIRQEPEAEPPPEKETETTGSVVQATSPTFATGIATSTLLMVGIILVFAIGGIVFLLLAFR